MVVVAAVVVVAAAAAVVVVAAVVVGGGRRRGPHLSGHSEVGRGMDKRDSVELGRSGGNHEALNPIVSLE